MVRVTIVPPLVACEQEEAKEVAIKRLQRLGWLPLLAITLGALPGNAQQTPALSEQEAYDLGSEAYVYGYPLVTMDTTRRVMTNVPRPEARRAPMGQFVNLRSYPDATFRDVTAPNADTLYSTAWLDLAKEPYVLHVPDEAGRYYLMPMLSGWTDVFASPGSRTTGTKAQDFAIVGPGWKGALPKGITKIQAPTTMVWILGRTYCTGTPADYQAVHAIQDQYKLMPLSAYGKPYTPPSAVTVDPNVDMKTPVREQVNAMDAGAYFKRLAILMKENPPAPADAPMVRMLARLGIVPGQAFDLGKLDPAMARGLVRAVADGPGRIAAEGPKLGKRTNGWTVFLNLGTYGTDYLLRAATAYAGLGANLPQDAVYPLTARDASGNPLNGANRYVMHFAKGQMPPVKAFWSLTLYNDQFFFVDNPLHRYTLSPRDPLKYNPDGSLDLYIQHDSPGQEKESNWLPAPIGPFILMQRLYWPEAPILEGSWAPPPVQRAR
ncbi:DUF1254 domain-containing protein [bacterium]|nr:DUF1254 domain-containing protein [bacterium]